MLDWPGGLLTAGAKCAVERRERGRWEWLLCYGNGWNWRQTVVRSRMVWVTCSVTWGLGDAGSVLLQRGVCVSAHSSAKAEAGVVRVATKSHADARDLSCRLKPCWYVRVAVLNWPRPLLLPWLSWPHLSQAATQCEHGRAGPVRVSHITLKRWPYPSLAAILAMTWA